MITLRFDTFDDLMTETNALRNDLDCRSYLLVDPVMGYLDEELSGDGELTVSDIVSTLDRINALDGSEVRDALDIPDDEELTPDAIADAADALGMRYLGADDDGIHYVVQ